MAMNYIREVFSDARLRYQVNKVINECITDNNKIARYERERIKRSNDRMTNISAAKNHISTSCNGSVDKLMSLNEINTKVESSAVTEAIRLADEHPEEILRALRARLNYANAEIAFSTLKLLETLVSSCNYSFHLALSKNRAIHERLLNLAIRRTEDSLHRQSQRLARLTLLEYSRMFIDDVELAPLARLAGTFELRTGKNLLRCLNIQTRKVKFKDPGPKDVITLSEVEMTTNSNNSSKSTTNTCCINGDCNCVTSSSGSSNDYNHNNRVDSSISSTPFSTSNNNDVAHNDKVVKPIKLSAAEVWPCHVCGYLNAPAANCCASCETARFVDTLNVKKQQRKTKLHSSAHFLSSQEEELPLPEEEVTKVEVKESSESTSVEEQNEKLKLEEHIYDLPPPENIIVQTTSLHNTHEHKVNNDANNEHATTAQKQELEFYMHHEENEMMNSVR